MRPHIGYPTPEDLPRKTSLHDAWLDQPGLAQGALRVRGTAPWESWRLPS